MSIEAEISDFAASVLLRYFRRSTRVNSVAPRLDLLRDLEILRAYWAVSETAMSLVAYARNHPHELQSLLAYRPRLENGVAKGPIDARRTVLHTLLTGDSAAMATFQAERSFESEANRLLAHVLHRIESYARRFARWETAQPSSFDRVQSLLDNLRFLKRLKPFAEVLRGKRIDELPSNRDLWAAQRARKRIYREAAAAYVSLRCIEAGMQDCLLQLIRESLVAPMEVWRRYELAVGLAACEAIALVVGRPLALKTIGTPSGQPLGVVGSLEIYWQSQTAFYNRAPLDPWEALAEEGLKTFGLPAGTDRPDFVVVDRRRGEAVALIEVKYGGPDSATSAFREAMRQLAQYSRHYASSPSRQRGLFGRSLIALSNSAPSRLAGTGTAPSATDFDAIRSAGLTTWASAVISSLT